MSDLRTAAQQALEALEQDNPAGRSATITALRAALAQQEPVAKMHVVFEDNNGALRRTPADCQAFGANGQPAAVYVGRQRYVPEQEQEPVAWRYKPMIGSPWSLSDDGYYVSCKRDNGYIVEPLYAHPPRRETEQEPTVRIKCTVVDNQHPSGVPFEQWVNAPRREWQGLSDEEINDGRDQLPTEDLCNWSFRQGVYFAEDKLKEKNNG
jgi:hypothetical protein